jgi:hypothetical protein
MVERARAQVTLPRGLVTVVMDSDTPPHGDREVATALWLWSLPPPLGAPTEAGADMNQVRRHAVRGYDDG